MSDKLRKLDPKIRNLRRRIEEGKKTIRFLKKCLKEDKLEIQLSCDHRIVAGIKDGYFAVENEWTGTEIEVKDSPEYRICVVCGFEERGKHVMVSGKDRWGFKKLTNAPILRSHHSIEAQELRDRITDTLNHSLVDLFAEMKKLGVKF